MTDETIARAARRFVQRRLILSDISRQIRQQHENVYALRSQHEPAAAAAGDAWLDLMLAVRDEED